MELAELGFDSFKSITELSWTDDQKLSLSFPSCKMAAKPHTNTEDVRYKKR